MRTGAVEFTQSVSVTHGSLRFKVLVLRIFDPDSIHERAARLII